MKYKDFVIDRLKNYGAHKTAVENLRERLDQLASLRCASAEERLDHFVCEKEFGALLQNKQDEVEAVEKALEALTAQERRVLERMYLHKEPLAVQMLVLELGYEKSNIYVLKEKALRHFAMAFYGIHPS